jgi:hypothetical protein
MRLKNKKANISLNLQNIQFFPVPKSPIQDLLVYHNKCEVKIFTFEHLLGFNKEENKTMTALYVPVKKQQM